MLTANSILKNLIRNTKKKNPLQINCSGLKKNCDRDRIQTCNPHIRSVVLYSVELRSLFFAFASAKIVLLFIPAKRNWRFLEENFAIIVESPSQEA